MYAQYGIESLGLKKKTEKKHKKKLLPKTEIWCLVKRCVRRKKCPNDPGFNSQVKCPVPFYPHGNGGQGIDLAAINLHCSAFAFLPAYFDRKIFLRNLQGGKSRVSDGEFVAGRTR